MYQANKAVRKTDPRTSHQAAHAARAFVGTQHAAIMRVLRRVKKANPEQIGMKLGLPAHSIRRRLPELERAGLICVTGETVPTISGRQQRVWRVV